MTAAEALMYYARQGGELFAIAHQDMHIFGNNLVMKINRMDEINRVSSYFDPYYRYPAEYNGFMTFEQIKKCADPARIQLARERAEMRAIVHGA